MKIEEATLAILAGGRSSRFQRDKSLISIRGRSLPDWLLDQLYPPFAQARIVIDFRDPPYNVEISGGALIVSDCVADKGPLGGILTALEHCSADYCFVLACDMPFPSLRLIEEMADMLHGQDALVPSYGRIVQPLFAFYSTKLTVPLRACVCGPDLPVLDFLDMVNVEYVEWEKLRSCDPGGRSFLNINYPEDIELLESPHVTGTDELYR